MLVRNHARDRLALGWVVQRHPARSDGPPVTGLAGTFVVKGTFQLVPGGPAEPWADGPEPLAGDTPWPDAPGLGLSYPTDFVPWKPRGEWIVVGMARPPRHYPRDAATDAFAWEGAGDAGRFMIHAAVGGSEKCLEVFGERHWTGRVLHLPTGPRAADDPTPVSYALAWGGPGLPANPIGTGYGGGELPRIERRGARTETYHDHRDPAGFGAVPSDWPRRAALRGTHDKRWLATRWPWLPDDIDYAHFLSAPRDQWIDGFFRGDEPAALVHLHPDLPAFEGFLPGIRPRLAVERRPASDASPGRFDRARTLPAEEVPLVLDTVWIDAERGQLVLVWRGLTAIATPKLSDIASVTLAAERLDHQPAAIETFIVAGDAGEPTAEVPAPAGEPRPPDPGPAERAAALASMIDEATAQVAVLTEQFETSGVSERMQQAAARAPSLGEQRSLIEALARAQGPGSAAAWQLGLLDELAAVEAAAEKVLAACEAEQAARKQAREAAAAARVLPRLPDGTVDIAEASHRGWRTIDLAGADLSGLDLAGADFAGADLSGVNLAGATLTGANLAGARLVEATLAAANLAGASLVGANLGRADLSRANLSGADLSHGDVTAARVSAVDWRGCRLTAAKLAGLDLYAADFSGCVADHADFARANLADATFCDAHLAMASFAKANVERVTFTRAVLEWTAFGEAIACGTTFTECDLGKVRAGQGDFRRATFTRCRGPEPVFEAARLDGATFVRCELPRARFAEAALAAAGFDRSDLREAVFEDARLADARLTKSNLFEAVFDRADLTGASLAGSNAYGCGFWDSVGKKVTVT
ncbi:MAG: DUF2169 domain-containing protein [Planctomycetia bacterium]|nr:DUF2169 domain-containing protein [Planctomycetia bacterium]